jgi:prolyl-tRNA editing enzyme YbaK/EbsC (Cys-tRNA(Pro) deacylase)
MEYGSITPIGLPKDWMILVDPLIKEQEQIIIGGGLVNSKISLPTELFLKIPNVEIVDGVATIRVTGNIYMSQISISY